MIQTGTPAVAELPSIIHRHSSTLSSSTILTEMAKISVSLTVMMFRSTEHLFLNLLMDHEVYIPDFQLQPCGLAFTSIIIANSIDSKIYHR